MIETRFRAFAILRLLQIRRIAPRKNTLSSRLIVFCSLSRKPLVVVHLHNQATLRYTATITKCHNTLYDIQ